MKSKFIFIKIISISFLLFLIIFTSLNFYYSPDKLTKLKSQFFSFDASSNFLGKLNLWYFFANQNDWDNAAKFESNLNQIHLFKLNNQPQELTQKLEELQGKSNKNTQDYLLLAKIQSVLGLNQEAIQSIVAAHQLDPIRPDLDQLFYAVTN